VQSHQRESWMDLKIVFTDHANNFNSEAHTGLLLCVEC